VLKQTIGLGANFSKQNTPLTGTCVKVKSASDNRNIAVVLFETDNFRCSAETGPKAQKRGNDQLCNSFLDWSPYATKGSPHPPEKGVSDALLHHYRLHWALILLRMKRIEQPQLKYPMETKRPEVQMKHALTASTVSDVYFCTKVSPTSLLEADFSRLPLRGCYPIQITPTSADTL
jgi:hypothetical protein